MGEPGGTVGIGEKVGFDRILSRDIFFSLLDFEVKRARRYQNFICLVLFRINQSSKESDGEALRNCYKVLSDLLMNEIRESDLIGFLEINKMVLLLPYADPKAGGTVMSRIQEALGYRDFKAKGVEVMIEQVCYPVHGTDVCALIHKALQ